MSSTMLGSARSLLLDRMYGTLSTHSLDCAGYPFGSLVPYVPDYSSKPILLISRLAQHTKNINADSRVSLMLSDATSTRDGDVQAAGRVTIVGDALPLKDEAAIGRYYSYYPDAKSYVEQLDFEFYRLEPLKVRFIGGFGQIHWVAPAELFIASPFQPAAEADIVEHMNEDHQEALFTYCKQSNLDVGADKKVRMVGVDPWGIHIAVGEGLLRVNFKEAAEDPNGVRKALISLLRD